MDIFIVSFIKMLRTVLNTGTLWIPE